MSESKNMSTPDVSKGEKLTILVVDDDPSIVNAVEMALKNKDYEFISSYSGEEALTKFEENDVDIVITDIKMPDMNGIELLKKIKSRAPETYVIMMTAYASVDSAVEAMREGASDYIRKPIEVKDIRTTLLGAIENLELEKFHKKTSTLRKGQGKKKPFETLKNLLEEGRRGLCISRTEPEKIKKEHMLENDLDFLTISDEGEDENKIHPRDLDKIKERIKDTISENESSVILIDSIDYLLNYNSLDKFRRFTDEVEESLVGEKATILISGEPKNINEEERGELEYLVSDMPARVISESISNHIRRKVISQLQQEEVATFTTLSRKTGVDDSPKLSFHLRKLESAGLIEKDKDKRYRLTETGEEAAETLEKLRKLNGKGYGQVAWIPR